MTTDQPTPAAAASDDLTDFIAVSWFDPPLVFGDDEQAEEPQVSSG